MTNCVGALHVSRKNIPNLVWGVFLKNKNDGKHSGQHSGDVEMVACHATHR